MPSAARGQQRLMAAAGLNLLIRPKLGIMFFLKRGLWLKGPSVRDLTLPRWHLITAHLTPPA